MSVLFGIFQLDQKLRRKGKQNMQKASKWFLVTIFSVVILGITALFIHQLLVPVGASQTTKAALESRIAALETRVTALESRINTNQASSVTSSPPKANTRSLSTASVQQAVNQAFQSICQGGQVSVIGIQELPGQNSAKVDLEYRQLECYVDQAGSVTNPPPAAKPRNPNALPSPEELFRPKPKSLSGKGTANIVKYNDGRSVLTTIYFNSFNYFTVNIPIK